MQRLILTNDGSAAGSLKVARLANFRIALERQLVWGRLPSDAELSGFFGARKKRQAKLHWLDYAPPWHLEQIEATGLGLVELCSRFDTIELWMDPRPNDQLQLICLLHYLRAHPEIASKLSLVQARVPMGGQGRICWQNGSCRPSKYPRVISNWRAGHGAPLARRRRKTGSVC
jgi:hypothetical protein